MGLPHYTVNSPKAGIMSDLSVDSCHPAHCLTHNRGLIYNYARWEERMGGEKERRKIGER